MKQYCTLSLILFLAISSLSAQPPKPQEGYRWTLNHQYSDEFNGSELDLTKWYNYHPFWQGRPPAKFTPSQVSVKDGLLVLTNKKIEGSKPGDTWTIAGAAVVSRGEGAHFGYYECSQKASKIRMSSTFWMSNRGAAGPEPCNDRYSQELDIQEAVGGAGSSSTFTNSMHSNTHYWYTDCNGNKNTYSNGSRIPLEKGEVSDTFHVYAANWKNPNTVEFYLDGKYGNRVPIATTVDPSPFERPMFINMVTETYDWVSPPSDEDLADSSRNTTYIDWVRSWKLVLVDEKEDEESPEGSIQNGGFETGDFTHWTGWGGDPLEVVSNQVHSGNYAAHIGGPGAPEYVVNLRAHTQYTLSCYGKVVEGSGPIFFGIKDAAEKVLGSVEVTETSFTKKSIQFTTESSGVSLKFYFYAPNSSAEGYADDFELIALDPSDTVKLEEALVFDETVFFDEKPSVLPASDHLSIRLVYQDNGDRNIRLKLLNVDSVLLGEDLYPAYSGYGVNTVTLELDSIPTAGKGYWLIADLLHPDSLSGKPIHWDVLELELQDPVNIAVKVLDVRDDLPIEDAKVTLNDSSGLTDTSGSIEFLDVPPGMVSIQVTKVGFDDLILPEIEVSRDTLFELWLLPKSNSVTVMVTDIYTTDPVQSASVYLGEQLGLTDYQGKVVFGAYAGETSLETSVARYASNSSQVNISSDTVLHIQLKRLLADARFVVKMDGSPLHNALVSVGAHNEYTSTIGQAFIPDLKTDTLYNYQVDYLEETLYMDSMVLKSDSTIRININTQDVPGPYNSSWIEIYPNPANGELHLGGLNGETSYSIYNVQGNILLQGTLKKQDAIDISTLREGIFFIHLSTEKHKTVKRFIKQ